MRRGFTLLEITVVLAILAIAAGAIVIRSHVSLRRAQVRDTVEEICDFDRLTRVQARQQDVALQMVYDLAAGTVTRLDGDQRTCGGQLQLPEGQKIQKLLVMDQEVSDRSVAVSVSRQGLSPTYAILVRNSTGYEQWFVVPGLTGHSIQTSNEKDTQDILASLAGGHDAH